MNIEINELETADYDLLENIKTALYRLWKLKPVVVLMTLVGFLASFIYVGFVGVETSYYASATIYSAVYGSYEESSSGVSVMNTYSSLLGSSRVCERAAVALNNPNITTSTLKNMVSWGNIYLQGASSDSKKYGYELTLVAISGSSGSVVEIANAMAKAYADEINDLSGINSLQVLDEASGFYAMNSINPKKCFILFGAAAFMLTAMAIFAKEFFSAKVYSVAQCEQNKDKILGLIPVNND